MNRRRSRVLWTLGLWIALPANLAAQAPDGEVDPAAARAILERGREALAAGRAEEAEELFTHSFDRARAAGEAEVEMLALGNLANVRLQRGDPDGAAALLDRALAAAERLDRFDLRARIHLSLAQVAGAREDRAAAVLHGRRAAAGFLRIGDRPAQAAALTLLGSTWLSAGLPGRALSVFDQALALDAGAGIGDDLPILHAMHLAAHLQSLESPRREHLEVEIEVGERLLAEARDRDPALARSTEAQLAEAHDRLALLADAPPPIVSPEAGIGRPGVDPDEALVLRGLAWSRAEHGDVAGALELCRESLELAQSRSLPEEESRSLEALGTLLLGVGQPERAECFYRRMRTLAEASSDARRLALSDLLAGSASLLQGNFEAATAALANGLTLARTLGDHDLAAIAHSGAAIVAVAERDPRRAIESWSLQIQRLRDARPPESAPGLEAQLRDQLESLLGDAEIPDEEVERALDLLASDPTLQGLLEADRALDSSAGALAAEWTQTVDLQVALALQGQAWALATLGEAEEAARKIGEAVAIVDRTGGALDRAGAHAMLGYVRYRAALSAGSAADRAGRLADAEAALGESIAEYESLRSSLGRSEGFSISSQDFLSQPYELLQRVLVERGEAGRALEVAERARGRALAAARARRRGGAGDPTETALPPAPALDEIRALARDSEAAIVVYSLLFDPTALLLAGRVGGTQADLEDTLLIWVVSPDGRVDLETVDLALLRGRARPTSLARLIEESRRSLGIDPRGSRPVTTDRRRPDQVLADLASLLIEPIAGHLTRTPGVGRLLVLPQGPLALVPFAALPGPRGEPLVAGFDLAMAPSAAVAAALRPASTGRWDAADVLVVGDPALPAAFDHLRQLDGARREARTIAGRFGVEPLIGERATLGAVVRGMADKKLIHLASHGLLERPEPAPQDLCTIDDGPLRDPRDLPGALILASPKGDGLLTAGAVGDLRLRAELVVLSACETGDGRLTGDGVIGLARSFLVAGAGTVVVSLWRVEDDPTALLMERFYEHLAAGGGAAAALRRAMLEVRREHADPRAWSGFVVVGRP